MSAPVLAEYFRHLAFKRLSAHEIDPSVSNGNEFQGVAAFRKIFGKQKARFRTQVFFLTDDAADGVEPALTELTWYNARASTSTRSPEYRLYYPKGFLHFQSGAAPGDLCIIAQASAAISDRADLFMIVAPQGSTVESQLLWLFGIGTIPKAGTFSTRSEQDFGNTPVGFAARRLLDSLGIDATPPAVDAADRLLASFPNEYPPTIEFSKAAAATVPAAMMVEDPDAALIALLEAEEAIFRGYERHHVRIRLKQGFSDDVDAFVAYSLSVQNRRKSRMGYALERHLSSVFSANRIRFANRVHLADGTRPDFVFPTAAAFDDSAVPARDLTMLGAKSSCKDRWRQVLAEASRLTNRHLLTLEPAITSAQTLAMAKNNLQLVVPKAIHATYAPAQQSWLWSVRAFVSHVA